MYKKILSHITAIILTYIFGKPLVGAVTTALTILTTNTIFQQATNLNIVAYAFVSSMLGITIYEIITKTKLIKK